MEGLSPTLVCITEIRGHVSNGHSIKGAIELYVRQHNTELSKELKKTLISWQMEGAKPNFHVHLKNPYQKTLLEILLIGLGGGGVMTSLETLEREVQLRSEEELEAHIQSLLIILLLPLTLFLFPAYILLLLGPLLSQLIGELSL